MDQETQIYTRTSRGNLEDPGINSINIGAKTR
jgi:hypothetical protein